MLHHAHAALRLSNPSPPVARGRMWSNVVATPVHFAPRNWHWCPSRSRTMRESRARTFMGTADQLLVLLTA